MDFEGERLAFLHFYCYFELSFSSDGSWDKYIKSLVVPNKQKLDGLYQIRRNFALVLGNAGHILIAVLQPSMECCCDSPAVSKLKASRPSYI